MPHNGPVVTSCHQKLWSRFQKNRLLFVKLFSVTVRNELNPSVTNIDMFNHVYINHIHNEIFECFNNLNNSTLSCGDVNETFLIRKCSI